jgi:hypothetical protein
MCRVRPQRPPPRLGPFLLGQTKSPPVRAGSVSKLVDHFKEVLAIMRGARNWAEFYDLLDRSLPRFNETLQLPFYDTQAMERLPQQPQLPWNKEAANEAPLTSWLWVNRYVAGLAIEVGAIFGMHDLKSVRGTLNGCRLGIFALP